MLLTLKPWLKDLIIASITALFVILSIWIPKVLEEKDKISKFTARKIIHSFSGLGILITPYLNYPIISGCLALIMTIVTRTSGRKSPTKLQKELFDAISEDEENDVGYLQGPYAYCLSITILVFLFVFFPEYYYIPISAVLIMMYADTLAAYVGKKYGKHSISIRWVGNKRTLEGTTTFIISSLIITFTIFYTIGKILPGNSILLTNSNIIVLSIFMSFSAAFLELLSPSKYDDLIVPLGVTILTSLLALILGIFQF